MKSNRLKITLAALALAVAILPGCKKFLDVNDNPNATERVDPQQLLPSVEAGVAHVISSQYQTFGNFWAQYWTQLPNSSQFRSVEAYTSGPNDFDRAWGILYANVLTDTDSLIVNAHLPRFQQYAAIALIMRAYAFQLLTDGFGDVPLTEALHGTSGPKGNRSPHYDPQEQVYDSIFVWLDRAQTLIDPASDYAPATDDILSAPGATITGLGMANWRRFSNTLELRAYLRLSEVDAARAQAGIAALYATNPEFLTTDVQLSFTAVGGNNNPLWGEVVALNARNQGASSTVMTPLKANSDPRIAKYYAIRSGQTDYISIPQGSFDNQPSNTPVSYPASGILSNTAPAKFMTAAESYFLQAEAVARGWAPGTALTLYQNGVRASFASNALTETQANTYLATAPIAAWPLVGVPAQVETIITQKWLAMVGLQGFEAWTEWRRTGYPDFLVKSEASLLGNDNLPARFIYPQVELTRNGNFPGLQRIDAKVWWDVN